MWWKSAVNRSFLLCFAACRTRSSACDTLSRSCARRVLCWPAFPSVPALRSTRSAAGCPALFAGFFATMAGSDFSRPSDDATMQAIGSWLNDGAHGDLFEHLTGIENSPRRGHSLRIETAIKQRDELLRSLGMTA